MRALVLTVLALSALAGCGAAAPTRPPARTEAAKTPAPSTPFVAALGDSITAGSPLWDPDPANRERIGPNLDPESQFERWAAPLRFRNCGVFGERTDEIALRLDACARGARALLVQGGINDIAQGRPVADAARDIARMVRRGKALGLPVTLVDVLPWNNGGASATPQIADLNRRIHAVGRAEHVRVLPFHDTLEDPGAPGTMRGDWTIDGDHPSVAGYKRLGRLVATTATVPP